MLKIRANSVQMTEQACGICSRPFNDEFIVPVNGSEERVAELRAKLASQKKELRAKKGTKRKLVETAGDRHLSLISSESR